MISRLGNRRRRLQRGQDADRCGRHRRAAAARPCRAALQMRPRLHRSGMARFRRRPPVPQSRPLAPRRRGVTRNHGRGSAGADIAIIEGMMGLLRRRALQFERPFNRRYRCPPRHAGHARHRHFRRRTQRGGDRIRFRALRQGAAGRGGRAQPGRVRGARAGMRRGDRRGRRSADARLARELRRRSRFPNATSASISPPRRAAARRS